MKNISIILIVILAFTACKKEKIEKFSGKESIAFYTAAMERDSTNFSFGGLAGAKERDTIFLKMRLAGRISNNPRSITIEAGPGTTATAGIHYILPKIVLPADSFTVRYPVVLLNSADLLTKTYKLVVRVKSDENFEQGPLGIYDQAGVGNIAQYTINFNNQFIKPDYWNSIRMFFGDYSDVKFKFMINTLGFSDFKPAYLGGKIGPSDFLNYLVPLKNALAAYNSLHGPLLDENNIEVVFSK